MPPPLGANRKQTPLMTVTVTTSQGKKGQQPAPPRASASETLRGSVISYKRGEKPSCGQHLAAARWPAVFSSMSMGFDANPRSSADAG